MIHLMTAGNPAGSFALSATVVFAVSFFCIPISSQAADVYLEPAVSVAAGYDDNRRLDPEEPDDQTGWRFAPQMELGAKTRTSEAVLNAAAHVNRYSDSELNSTDWFADLNLLNRWRRDELGLLAGYRRASTITTELEDTGVLEEDQIREDWTISPYWTHQLSRRTETTLLYEFSDVAFKEGTVGGFRDFQEHRVESTVSRRLNRTTSVYGRAEYLRFEGEDTTTADDVSFLIGLERNFTRTLDAGAGLGAQYSETDSPSADGGRVESSDDGFIFEVFAIWTLQRSVLTAEASRSVESSGRGSLSVVDSVSAGWARELSRTWDLNLSGSASWQDFEPTGTLSEEDRVYYDADASLVWQARPRWEVDLTYRYRRQELDDPQNAGGTVTEADADSNSAWLTLRYSWERMDLSQ